MSKLVLDISMSLDGYVAGPNQSLDEPLGEGGEELHEWAFPTATFREMHGNEAGESGPDDDVIREHFGRLGATVMGRRMFSSGEGPWEDDPKANGWWGDEPPYHHPVFVITHHEREPLPLEGTTFTFVTDGIESALEQAREAAGGKDIAIAGGASVADQYLKAGLVDEFQVHVAPMFLGGGSRLFDDVAPGKLECVRVVESPSGTTHLKYRLAK